MKTQAHKQTFEKKGLRISGFALCVEGVNLKETTILRLKLRMETHFLNREIICPASPTPHSVYRLGTD